MYKLDYKTEFLFIETEITVLFTAHKDDDNDTIIDSVVDVFTTDEQGNEIGLWALISADDAKIDTLNEILIKEVEEWELA